MPAIMNPHIKKCFHHHDPITSVLKNLTIISGSSKTCGDITAGCYSYVAIVLLQWMPSYYYHLKCPAVSKVTDWFSESFPGLSLLSMYRSPSTSDYWTGYSETC